jgi:hypothetical protein
MKELTKQYKVLSITRTEWTQAVFNKATLELDSTEQLVIGSLVAEDGKDDKGAI